MQEKLEEETLTEGISEFTENLLTIRRVTKVTKGGRTFRLSVWVVVGDGKGSVGIGHGKAKETPEAIQKAVRQARKNIVKVVIEDGTLPHDVIGRMGASKILLKPAPPGTGIIACQLVRSILEAAGYENAVTKSLGSNTAVNLIKATIDGLMKLKDKEKILNFRKKSLHTRGEVKDAKEKGEIPEDKAEEKLNRRKQESKEDA